MFERLARDAQSASTLGAFRSELLKVLMRELGAESGSLLDSPRLPGQMAQAVDRIGAFGTTTDPTLIRAYLQDQPRYERSNWRLLRAMDSGYPIVDSDVYTMRARERLAVYAEILAPQGARSLLSATVKYRGRPVAQLVLKRHGRSRWFHARDAARLGTMLPPVALADAGFQHVACAPALSLNGRSGVFGAASLSAREAQVAHLACKGLHNAEIAALLGTSCETVKKQMRMVIEKAGVSNRTELAGLWAMHAAP